jgi:hypothetical protein
VDFLSHNPLATPHLRPRRLLRPALLAVLCCLACPAIAAAQFSRPTEYQVKAAFLLNFLKCIEWPVAAFPDTRAPFVLGVLGDDPFGDSLNVIVAGQLAQGRGIILRNFRFGDDLRHCHVLFVSASEQPRVAQILESLQGASVLTVSDIPAFAGVGGVMQFFTQEERVRFAVNAGAAAQANLRISAKLLALARVINDARGAR